MTPPASSSRSTTVGIVEDDPAIRSSWVKILNRLPGYKCVGEYGSGEEALVELTKNPTDFVLMDINLPGMSGVECTQALKLKVPNIEIIMLTMFGDRDRIFDALRAGAGGYLLKRTTPAALKAALEEARAGGAPMSPQIARQVVQFFQPQKPSNASEAVDRLSEREAEILRLLTEGCPYKEIADKLGISMDTVRTYIRRIYQKLHVHSRTDAVVKYLHSKEG